MNINELLAEAERYAANYPNVVDEETRYALFISHLAYLLNRG